MLSTFFELLHGFYCDKKGTASGAASSEITGTSLGSDPSSDKTDKTASAGGNQTAVAPQFRKNLHICLQSETSLPDALVKLAVLADACPPEMFLGDADENTPSCSPCLNLHVFDKVEKRKDPIRGFLRMLSKRPDIWKIHYYNGNEQSSTSSSGAARKPTATNTPKLQSGEHDKKSFDAVAEKIGAMAQVLLLT